MEQFIHFPGSLRSYGGSMALNRDMVMARDDGNTLFLIHADKHFNCSSNIQLVGSKSSAENYSLLNIECNMFHDVSFGRFFFLKSLLVFDMTTLC